MDVPRHPGAHARYAIADTRHPARYHILYWRSLHLHDSTPAPDAGRDLRAPVGRRVAAGGDDRAPDLQQLPRACRVGLPGLPILRAEAEAALSQVRTPARTALGVLSLLCHQSRPCPHAWHGCDTGHAWTRWRTHGWPSLLTQIHSGVRAGLQGAAAPCRSARDPAWGQGNLGFSLLSPPPNHPGMKAGFQGACSPLAE